MRTSEIVILKKEIVKRKKFLKNEFKRIILKSIVRNFSINNIIRIEAFRKIIFLKKNSSISRQNQICIGTSRIGGVFKNYTMSRHFIKKTAKFNMLHNTKIKSW